jgi:dihydrofolate synthase/folylpolyglutamate synthase
MKFETYSDVEVWLNARPQFSKDGKKATDFRPAKMVNFCSQIGHPERNGKYIHVAGTNGKGTTCAMIASVYQAAGYKTGLYTSPHIEHWRERIKINGIAASEQDVVEAFRIMMDIPGFDQLTYFELTTVAAFLIFKDANVDLAVIETGLGGRLDATNILVPLVSVITSIALDHTEFLGDTIEAIAFEKAGIIKLGIPVVVGDLPAPALEVVKSVAESLNARLIQAIDNVPYIDQNTAEIVLHHAPESIRFTSDIPSVTSAINSAMALSVAKLLNHQFFVNPTNIKMGLEHASRNTGLRGRMEQLIPGRNWYFDGAHNQESLQVLLLNLGRMAPLASWNAIFTMMGDKANKESLKPFTEFKNTVFWRSNSERSADPKLILQHLPDVIVSNEDEIVQYITSLTSEFVIFTGSFYFYNEVKRWMHSIAATNC